MKQFLINLITSIKAKLVRHIDKVLHFFVCYGIVLTGAVVGHPVLGIIVGAFIGTGMEFFDKIQSKFSWGDIVADIIGITLAIWIMGV